MPLTLKSGFMTSSRKDGRLLMSSGTGDRIVLVTHEALEAIADPPRADEFRLQAFIEAFSSIASNKFDKRQLDERGGLSVTVEDARKWRAASD